MHRFVREAVKEQVSLLVRASASLIDIQLYSLPGLSPGCSLASEELSERVGGPRLPEPGPAHPVPTQAQFQVQSQPTTTISLGTWGSSPLAICSPVVASRVTMVLLAESVT